MATTVGSTAITFNDGTTQSTAGTRSLSTSGWEKLPSGLIIQWGTGSTTSGTGTVTWPTAFPTACVNVQATIDSSGTVGIYAIYSSSRSTTTGGFYSRDASNPVSANFLWFAIGY